MIVCIHTHTHCEMITTSRLQYPSPHTVTICVCMYDCVDCVVRTLKIYSQQNSSVYNGKHHSGSSNKKRTSVGSSNPTSGYISKRKDISYLQEFKFIVTLFTIAKICKQSKCPSTDERIQKMWCMCAGARAHARTHTHTHTNITLP